MKSISEESKKVIEATRSFCTGNIYLLYFTHVIEYFAINKRNVKMESNFNLQRRFARDPSIVSRKIAGEFILVPIRQKAGDVESIYTLNEVGGYIWECIDGEKTVEELRDMIVDEFEVSLEEAEADIAEFLQHLETLSVVRAV